MRLRARLLRAEDERDAADSSLTEALASPSPELRQRAALALGRIADPLSLGALARALADPVPAVQHEAAFSLGQLGVPGAQGALLHATLARDPELAARAAEALAKITWTSPDEGRRVGAVTLARVLGEGASTPRDTAALARALRSSWRFGAGTPGLAEALARFSAHADPSVAEAAVFAAFRSGDPGTVGLLDQAVLSGVGAVRGLACRGLARLAADRTKAGSELDPAWSRAILTLAHDEDRDVRVAALTALTAFPPPDDGGVSVLEGNLASSEHQTQRAAITLAKSWKTRAASTLLEGLITGGAADAAADAVPAVAAIRGLEAFPALTRAAGAGAWTLRAAVADALAMPDLGSTPEGRELLDRLLVDADPRVVASALEAAAKSERPGREVLALAHLGAPDVVVRAVAASLLPQLAGERLPGDEAARALRRTLHEAGSEPSADARISALEGLTALLGKESGGDLGLALEHPDFVLRRRAAALAAESGAAVEGAAVGVVGTGRPFAFYLRAAELERAATPLVLILETSRGPVLVDLATARTPLTALRFVELAGTGFFDGLTFHRVVPGFVAQGGCPRGDGWGGPGVTVRCETDDARYLRGTAGMALSGKDTGGSQFFFTLTPQPHLEGRYTVFGQVRAESLAVMDQLHRFDRIDSARVEEASPAAATGRAARP